jgi:FAD:protein FMN transferase
MTQPPNKPETTFVQSDWAAVKDVHRFAHQAMATTFEIVVQHTDPLYARQAAHAAFDELDQIEGELSRYLENSDVARINRVPAGEPLPLSIETFECLRISQQMYEETGGVFDVTIGLLLDCWRDEDKQPRVPSADELRYARAHTGMSLLKLNERGFTVELFISPVRVDLGGVGKGFGVDRMAALLEEWDIDRALIHGGFSSVLALDAPQGTDGWPITLSDPTDRRRIVARLNLKRMAVSGSGVEKGGHIIDPRVARPIEGKIGAWSVTPDATTGDILSTAFMIMTPREVKDYCDRHPGVRGLLIVPEEGGADRIVSAGPWPPGELVH